MRQILLAIAVASSIVTALPYSAAAYCRGCAVSNSAHNDPAAAAIIGSARAQAYEPGPIFVPPSDPVFFATVGDSGRSHCRDEKRRLRVASGNGRGSRLKGCN
jgi:hypothetical protein